MICSRNFILFLVLIVLVICDDVSSEWMTFREYLKIDKSVDSANFIKAEANCAPNTIQIFTGDCRPLY